MLARNPTAEFETAPSRYVVGIDLGTTNSAICYVDTLETSWSVRSFAVPQLVAPGQVEARSTLPSFLYQPAETEFSDTARCLPWGAADSPWRDLGSCRQAMRPE